MLCISVQLPKSTGDIHRKKKRRFRSAWSRGEIKQPKKKRLIEKDAAEKKDSEAENEGIKTEEEEAEDREEGQKDGEKSDDDVSVHSTCNLDEEDRGEVATPGTSKKEEVGIFESTVGDQYGLIYEGTITPPMYTKVNWFVHY